MARIAVRRVNEWDGPSMLKVYSPYTGTANAPEEEPPELQAYIQRIDRYTYGLGWLLCEIDCQTAGFCHLTENRNAPGDLFSVEFQLYVKPEYQGIGVGRALWSLMREMMEEGSRREVFARVREENGQALGFFLAMGFEECAREDGLAVLRYALKPADPEAERPTKPYLIDKFAYEDARERAAAMVDISSIADSRWQPENF